MYLTSTEGYLVNGSGHAVREGKPELVRIKQEDIGLHVARIMAVQPHATTTLESAFLGMASDEHNYFSILPPDLLDNFVRNLTTHVHISGSVDICGAVRCVGEFVQVDDDIDKPPTQPRVCPHCLSGKDLFREANMSTVSYSCYSCLTQRLRSRALLSLQELAMRELVENVIPVYGIESLKMAPRYCWECGSLIATDPYGSNRNCMPRYSTFVIPSRRTFCSPCKLKYVPSADKCSFCWTVNSNQVPIGEFGRHACFGCVRYLFCERLAPAGCLLFEADRRSTIKLCETHGERYSDACRKCLHNEKIERRAKKRREKEDAIKSKQDAYREGLTRLLPAHIVYKLDNGHNLSPAERSLLLDAQRKLKREKRQKRNKSPTSPKE